jgi:hypothetical protein
MMDAFVSGQSRSGEVVEQMEAEFAATDLDGDERFKDLQLAFAMFGAGDRAQDEQPRGLKWECQHD